MHLSGKALSILLLLTVIPTFALAAGDLSKQDPIEVKVRLGSAKNELTFSPNKLTFETGKLYKLVMINSSDYKHYFSSPGFAASIWTRKVQDGSMEVKGAIREVGLLPGKKAEWFFVPVKTGVFGLFCHIKGHREAGMEGKIIIK